MPNTPQPRLVVLGLDGLPWSLAKKLASTGSFPGLAKLTESKNCYPIQPELPELSPVNWTSFYTAAGPEEHGIFGFIYLNPQNYSLFRTTSQDVQSKSIFQTLSEKNILSKVINLPHTYPAEPLNGMLICGFVSDCLEQAVYPKFLLPRLKQENYKLEADTITGSTDYEFLLSELSKTLDSRKRALELFWPDLSWDLFVLVLTETDRLFHFLFPALEDQSHAWHLPCIQLLKKWDRLIQEVQERYFSLPEPKRFLVLADHGFSSLKTEVDLNCWLKQNKFLSFSRTAKQELDASCIFQESLAFALDPSRIHVHTQDRYRYAQVPPQDKEKIKEDLKSGLMELRFQGEPVFKQILDSKELYPGSCSVHLPDLVCLPRQGFELKAKFNRQEVFGQFSRQGTHNHEDAFFYDSAGSKIKRLRETGGLVLDFFQKPVLY